eukprot:14424876-Alexandrium_andersonii.AAC.1
MICSSGCSAPHSFLRTPSWALFAISTARLSPIANAPRAGTTRWWPSSGLQARKPLKAEAG